MCYPKPGPRCYGHTKQTIKILETKAQKAKAAGNEDGYRSISRELLKEKIEHSGTPTRQKELNAKIETLAEGDEKEHLRFFLNKGYAYRQSKMRAMKISSGEPDIESANNTFLYAQYSLQHNHVHNASHTGSDAELYYYSSPAGRLELKRRVENNESLYVPMREKLDDPHFKKMDLTAHIDTHQFHDLSASGEKKVLGGEELRRKDPEVGSFLVNKSYEWYSQLTTEEQETIAQSTSNGFLYLTDAVSESEDVREKSKIFLSKTLRKQEDAIYETSQSQEEEEERLRKLHKGHVKDYHSTMMKAMSKAPRVEKPYLAYRGTSGDSLQTIVSGEDREKTPEQLSEKFVAGDFNGATVSPDSRMSKIPQSASLTREIAERFMGRKQSSIPVVFEMQQKTLASPVMSSAWGVGEMEVFTNPHSTYTVSQARHEKNRWDETVLVVSLTENAS